MKTRATMFATAGALAALISTSAFAQQQQYDGGRHGRRDQQTQQPQQTQRQRQPQQFQQPQQVQQSQQVQWQRQQQPVENRSYTRNDNRDQRMSGSERITSFSRERDGYRGGRGLSVNLSLGGILGAGYGGGYGSGYLSGVVESVDYRDGLATLRDDASRRIVEVNLRGNVQQLRRGDFVTLEGQWDRSNIFDAYRIDDVR